MLRKQLLVALICLATGFNIIGMEKQAQVITLVGPDNQEFQAPEEIALQSEQIKDLLAMGGQEATAKRVEFKDIPSKTLQDIAAFMWSVYLHKDLKGDKLLLDAVDKEVKINDLIAFIKAADFLDLKIALTFAASRILADEKLTETVVKKIGTGELGTAVKNSIYTYLLSGKEIKWDQIPGSFGFSIQDYLDYRPQQIQVNKNGVLDLSHLAINNLAGLENIPNKETIKLLHLHDNEIQQIPAEAFAGLNNLEWLYLSNNQIQQIDAQAFAGLANLEVLNLGNNKIQQIHGKALAGLTNLQLLDLRYNPLSKETKTMLRTALPGVSILF